MKENCVITFKKLFFIALLLTFIMGLQQVSCKIMDENDSLISPSEYFLKRSNTIKHRRRDASSPFKYDPNTRLHNLDQKPKRSLYSKEDDGSEFQSYDGTISRTVIMLDNHPFIVDAGCGVGTMYLRVKKDHVNSMSKEIKAGTTLISSDRTFFKCMGEQSILNVIMSSTVKNIENSLDQYFELTIRPGKLQDVFINLSFNMRVLPQTRIVSPTTNSTNNDHMKRWKLFNSVLFNTELVNWNYDKLSGGAKVREFKDSYFSEKNGGKVSASYSCKDCYLFASVGVELVIEMTWFWLDYVEIFVLPNVRTNIDFTLEAHAEKQFSIPILPKTNVLIFSIVFIPCTVFVSVDFRVKLEAKLNFNVRFSFSRAGKVGFRNTRPIVDIKGEGPSLSMTNYDSSINIEAALVPTIGLSALSVIDFSTSLVPYYGINIYTPPARDRCSLGLNHYVGIDIEFLLARISILGFKLYSGFERRLSLLNRRDLGNYCLINRKRMLIDSSLGSIMTIEKPCCQFENQTILNQQSTIVDIVLTFTNDSYKDGEYLVMDGCFNRTCTLFYDDVSFVFAESYTSVNIHYLQVRHVTNVTLRVEKLMNETVILDIYIQRDVEMGKNIPMSRGIIGIQQPYVLPHYLSFNTTGGDGSLHLLGSDELIDGDDVFLDMYEESYPIYFSFIGSGQVIAFPIYSMKSGDILSLLVTKASKFCIWFSNTNLGPNIPFESMILSSYNKAVIPISSNLYEIVKIQVIEKSSYSISSFNQVEESQVLDGHVNRKYDTIQEFFFFNIFGSFPDMYFNVELLNVYLLDIRTDSFNETILKQVNRPIVLRLLYDTSHFQNGMVIHFSDNVKAIVHNKVPTMNVIHEEALSRDDKFVISQYFNNKMNTGELFVRLDPIHHDHDINDGGLATHDMGSFTTSEPFTTQRSTTFKTAPTIKTTFSTPTTTTDSTNDSSDTFSINIEPLKSLELITSLKFISPIDGSLVESIDFSHMFSNYTRIAIMSKDKQYSINFSKFQSALDIFTLLKASVNGTAYWNEVALPILHYHLSHADDIRKVIEMVNPQTLIITIPKLPMVNIGDEILEFGSISANLFMPPPREVILSNTLSIINKLPNVEENQIRIDTTHLTPGEIGAIISSVVGGCIIIVLLVLVLVLIGFLLYSRRKSVKKDQTAQRTEHSTSNSSSKEMKEKV